MFCTVMKMISQREVAINLQSVLSKMVEYVQNTPLVRFESQYSPWFATAKYYNEWEHKLEAEVLVINMDQVPQGVSFISAHVIFNIKVND